MSTEDIVESAAQKIVARAMELLTEEIELARASRPAPDDARSKTWGCAFVFRMRNNTDDDWETVGATDGVVLGPSGDPTTIVCERVAGLHGIAAKCEEYAEALGAPNDYFTAQMMRPLHNLRPTLSRKDGVATLRRSSRCGLWHLSCYVFREDRIP